jgi:hypothetical protein
MIIIELFPIIWLARKGNEQELFDFQEKGSNELDLNWLYFTKMVIISQK